MAFQFGLALLGPPGWAAAIAITAGLMIAGAMASDNMGISEDSPFYEWTHSDGDESPRQVQPETPKVITPSVTPQQAADYYAIYNEIEKQIDEMPDALFRQVLRLRYLEEMPLHQIAAMLAYSDKYILNIHGKALQDFGQRFLGI